MNVSAVNLKSVYKFERNALYYIRKNWNFIVTVENASPKLVVKIFRGRYGKNKLYAIRKRLLKSCLEIVKMDILYPFIFSYIQFFWYHKTLSDKLFASIELPFFK